jgi:uncharacterized membrane protein
MPSNRSAQLSSRASSFFNNTSNVCGVTLFNIAVTSRRNCWFPSTFGLAGCLGIGGIVIPGISGSCFGLSCDIGSDRLLRSCSIV